MGSAAATTMATASRRFLPGGQLIAATVFNAENDAMLADVRSKVDAMLEAHPPIRNTLARKRPCGGCGPMPAAAWPFAPSARSESMKGTQAWLRIRTLTLVDHPMVQHKLPILRDKDTSSKKFRELIKELALFEGYGR